MKEVVRKQHIDGRAKITQDIVLFRPVIESDDILHRESLGSLATREYEEAGNADVNQWVPCPSQPNRIDV
ncbi:MAG: hypothetical protein HYX51_10615 [Chloroflexi bacterium]|nr:hypothetical protein [Chloroflexota bacterium]